MFRIVIAGTTSFVAGFLHGRAERRLEDAEQRREQFLQRFYVDRRHARRMDEDVLDLQLDVDRASWRRVKWLMKYGKLSREEALDCFSDA